MFWFTLTTRKLRSLLNYLCSTSDPVDSPVTASPSQTTVSTITNDLARSIISTNDSPDLSKTNPPTNKHDDFSDVNTPIGHPNSERECTNCGNFNAKSYCAGCHQAPNTDGTPHLGVRYCSKECQKIHWPAHRLECKNLQTRKALFRAARLLQKMWYAVRRESFDNTVIGVEEVNGELLMHEGDYNLEPTKRVPGFYREFPDAIFKNEQDAEACLNSLYCTDSLTHMHMVTNWLLKDICVDVKEVKVQVNKPTRKCRYTRDEFAQEFFLHEVLQVRLQSGEVYAIDFTGAQYGWYDPITEWNKFNLRCSELIRITPSGVQDKLPLGSRARSWLVFTFSDPWDNRTEFQRAIPVLGECLKREFNKVFIQEVISKHPRGSDILKLSSIEFEVVKREILSKTKQITSDAAEKVDVLLPIIIGETQLCNEEMRENAKPDRCAIVKHGLYKLAALFNSKWARDGSTGRLTSVSLKRMQSDRNFNNNYVLGKLAESKLWGDLTLDDSMLQTPGCGYIVKK
ncbi:hypothetical protein E4T44_05252 [Aureobasidium sp. EXF-8845]|nr:hypothetical protein E4T44_05252 [Aureobasidium sp. EXF-8845]KAI4851894.1 hypothetical protein E4T45_04908 [Aureobasidium sp. EXF-8846]